MVYSMFDPKLLEGVKTVHFIGWGGWGGGGGLYKKPLKLALRVVLNSALGLGVLWLLNSTAPVTGLTLGVNWFNALTVGVLGLPGLGLLLLVKWVLV